MYNDKENQLKIENTNKLSDLIKELKSKTGMEYAVWGTKETINKLCILQKDNKTNEVNVNDIDLSLGILAEFKGIDINEMSQINDNIKLKDDILYILPKNNKIQVLSENIINNYKSKY